MTTRQSDPNRGRAGRGNLMLEALEDRCCPSAATNALVVQGHTLNITTGNKNDTVTISDLGNGTVNASITGGDGSVTLQGKSITAIQVNTGTGADQVNYTAASNLATSETLNLNLGSGSNQVNLNYSKGVTASSLNINLKSAVSNLGGDQISAVFGAIDNTALNFQTNLGGGGDHFTTLFSGDLLGTAAVNMNTAVGSGYEGVNLQTQANIAKTASMKINTVGGTALDTLHADYSGQLMGKLSITQSAGVAGDLVASDVTIAKGSTGSLSDSVGGGANSDLLVLSIHDNSGHAPSLATGLSSLTAVMTGNKDDNGLVTSNVKVNNVAVTLTK